jgi:hypothetical protein
MLTTSDDDAADARSASNLASTSSSSQDGFHGVSTVTPATITQSQSQDYNNSTNEDTVDSPTAAILCSMRDFAFPEIALPPRLLSPMLRRALNSTDQDGWKRHGQNLFQDKSKKKKNMNKLSIQRSPSSHSSVTRLSMATVPPLPTNRRVLLI